MVGGVIGPEGKWSVDLKGDQVVLSVSYDGEGGGVGLSGSVHLSYFLEALKAKIPNPFVDMLIDVAEKALKSGVLGA